MRNATRMQWLVWGLILGAVVFTSGACRAESTVSALMVSDIHFDPFHDPTKAKLLARDPVSEWAEVLSAPASPGAAAAFSQLQETCGAKGVDTPWTLLRSSLGAMDHATSPAFVTVSGDLLAHKFGCRFQNTVGGSAEDYSRFAVKTLAFVVQQLRSALPGVPIYIALGNNDSGCGDYRLDPDSDFLRQTAAIVAAALPAELRPGVRREFPRGGYYAVNMAAPMKNTRLIVLNDVFLSPSYRSCGGAKDGAPAVAELAWLSRELAQAKQAGQKVWVMGHIPPGVNAYATAARMKDVCGGKKAVLFLVPSGLDDLLTQYGAEIRLALFAHTHMDEVRLMEPHNGGRAVAVKLAPSITPVHGNDPAFTVAAVNPDTAVLTDYKVIAASNQTGVNTRWSVEYDYSRTYHEASFTPAALRQMIAEFEHDPGAKSPASEDYLRNYYVGGQALELKSFWQPYVCSLDHLTTKGYAACVCGEETSDRRGH